MAFRVGTKYLVSAQGLYFYALHIWEFRPLLYGIDDDDDGTKID